MAEIPLLILGAGTFAIETLEIAELAGGFRPLGFIVSERPREGASHAGLPVFHAGATPVGPGDALLVAGIVSNRRRAFIEEMHDRGFRFATLVHPGAIVSPRAVVMEGAVIGAGVIVASHTHVGAHALLNRGANIGHDNTLGAYVTVGPGATLAGAVAVGAGAYVGVGAVVRDHLTIGAGAVIAAGAVVVKPVPAHVLVAGCPAAVVRDGVDGL
jgi:sugar O-acyltransferase (sialic acid O-acetyltransferase NeuD family)